MHQAANSLRKINFHAYKPLSNEHFLWGWLRGEDEMKIFYLQLYVKTFILGFSFNTRYFQLVSQKC